MSDKNRYIERRGGGDAFLDQPADLDLAIGVIAIAFAIAAPERRADAVDEIDRLEHVGARQVADQPITLSIDVGRDAMGHRAGIMAEADALVEGGGAEPNRPLLLALVQHPPQADMAALPSTAA